MAILATLSGGCSKETPALPTPARKATGPSAADVQRLKEAKTAAAAVFANVEACEAAVLAGPKLDDLSRRSAHAHASVQAFSRTQNARLLPAVTAAMALAAKDYADGCTAWRADEKDAAASWNRKGPRAGIKSVNDCRHPERYEALWVKGGIDLGKARQAMRDATL
jgi:hypothetical protein